MRIVGIEGLDGSIVADELQRGAKFVIYQYCISVIIMTFRRPSNIYFVRAGQSAVAKGLGFSAISLLFGWWGLPWGPIYTIGSFITNFGGGRDVTQDVLAGLNQQQT
jgi:hypothetical protein